nr:GtrA family protein [Mycolicibacterium fortuitum subsp. fortuitum DSM 46621 = ATCC 6841 = JCM 6387]CRL79471.1 GtrA family protein [Mycolicibacter nonchromogenicus]
MSRRGGYSPVAYGTDTFRCHSGHVVSDPSRLSPAARFHRMCALVVRSLPAPLNSLVAPTFLGFALINTFTFGVDLAILTALHGALRTPLPVAVTVGYAVAFGLAYYLNRTLNFRSHAAVGPQLTVYVLAVVINYLAFILGISSGLAALGVEYHLARIVAGGCEALFMYSAMRWVVFR